MRMKINDTTLLVGYAADIKSVYNSLYRGYVNDRHNLYPEFCDKPKYNDSRIYGLVINFETMRFGIMNEHAILDTLISEGVLS